MAQDDLLNKLINNAFDFLEMAIGQFKAQPKYSAIHFCTALELILKARLMSEHWSLIVAGEPDLKKFKSGDFRSHNFKDLIPKIENVLDDKLPEKAKNSFMAIAQHRNKMVHFFHEADDKTSSEKIIEAIAIEQSSGWFFLRRLLENWDEVFGAYKEQIQSLNYKMKGHEVYLSAVFKNIKPEIEADKKKGALYRSCLYCAREASKEHSLTAHIIESKCKVCLITGCIVRIPCPDKCGENIEVDENWNSLKVCKCGFKLDNKKLSEILDTEPVSTDNYFDYIPINCAYCHGGESVIHHHDYFFCTECISVFSEWGVCGWCGEGQVGGAVLEDSYLTGCEFCDGHTDWG